MADQIIQCTDCEHSFDAMDDRAWISARDADSHALCAMCFALLKSSRDWAVWNSCNGVFETFPTRAEAREVIKARYSGCDATVMPVRTILEPEDSRHMREWSESEMERRRA